MESLSPQVVSTAKLPILNPNEFNLWKMRIEQYFLMTDYLLWEVILNSDSLAPIRVIKGVVQPVAPTTAEQRLARNNELKTHDLEEQSLDDLFNSLKIYEAEVKSYFSASTSTQNIAFVSSNTDNTNEPISAAASISTDSAKIPVFALPNVDTLSNAVIYLFFASQSNSPQLDNDDLKQIDADDLEEMDLKWQMAMLTVRPRKGHFARECRSPKDTRRTIAAEPQRRNIPVETSTYHWFPNVMVWAAMTGVFRQRRNLPIMLLWHSPLQVLPGLTMRYNSVDGYHVVPLPYTKTFMPPKPDLVFNNAPIVNETVHTAFNIELSSTKPDTDLSYTYRPSAPIIEDWVSDSEDDSKPKILQNAPSFVPHTEQVKPPRPSVKHVETFIPATTPKTTIPKTKRQGKNRNRNACFGNPQHALKDKGVIDSGCSRHMTGNMSYLSDFEEINGGYVAFGGNQKGGKISGKGKIRTGKLDFDDVYFVKELKFNLFSVLQMCDKKNSVLFTDTECVVLSPDFKLLDENQVLLRVPRENNMYNIDLKNIVPYGNLTNKPNVASSGPTWLFDIDTLTRIMNYQPITAGNQSNPSAGVQEQFNAEKVREENVQQYVFFPVRSSGSKNPQNTNGDAAFEEKEPEFEGRKPESEVYVSTSNSAQTKKHDDKTKTEAKGKSHVKFLTGYRNLSAKFEDFSDKRINEVNAAGNSVLAVRQIFTDRTNTFSVAGSSNVVVSPTHGKSSYMDTSQLPDDPNMPELEDITYSDDEKDVGAEADFTNLEISITEEVYVCQPLGFEDPDYPDKVYKVVKALYGLHQAPKAWYETLANYLLENDLCKAFEKLMKDKFQMSSMRELTFFLGLQVKQKPDGIFISQEIYVAEILRKFGLTDRKSANPPIDTKKPLLKDLDGEDMDVHTYRSMIDSLMYLTTSRLDIMFVVCACACFQVTLKVSHLHAVKRIFKCLKGKPHLGLWYPKNSPFNLVAYSDSDYAGASLDRKSITGGCQFLGCRLISWQCKKQTVVATSSTEAEYVAAAS
uniref:Uncharacterized protein n=1 Tax=Tanacetum cinerariifolium TaxID=118510 RepID=A0A6L2JYL0_TANCI|nr:hypothetical protein [Tanacetum cinerariifolium]